MVVELTGLDKERAEYARQIVKHVRETGDSKDAQWYVDQLLLEWGAKAYRQGERHMAQRVLNYAAGYLPKAETR